MAGFFAVVHNLVMLVGLFYIAQFVVGIFNRLARENNPIYRLFRFHLAGDDIGARDDAVCSAGQACTSGKASSCSSGST